MSVFLTFVYFLSKSSNISSSSFLEFFLILLAFIVLFKIVWFIFEFSNALGYFIFCIFFSGSYSNSFSLKKSKISLTDFFKSFFPKK